MSIKSQFAFLGVSIILFCGSFARAQTGASLMLVPFPAEKTAEAKVDAFFFADGETDGSGPNDFELSIYDFRGRVAPLEDKNVVRFGIDGTYFDIESNDPAIPERLTDQSVAVGFGIAKIEQWEFGATVGVGFAGDLPYSDSDAVYAKASIVGAYRIDDKSAWQFGLDYNGNRGIFPDVPFPFLAYARTENENLSYVIGFPFSSVRWVPVDRLTIRASLSPASVINAGFYANIDYEFIDTLHIYGEYDTRFEAFHLDGDDENRRLFYRHKRLEVGLRWELEELTGIDAELRVAGGYAFDREFERGWDVRDTDNIRDLSDEPYLRMGVDLSF